MKTKKWRGLQHTTSSLPDTFRDLLACFFALTWWIWIFSLWIQHFKISKTDPNLNPAQCVNGPVLPFLWSEPHSIISWGRKSPRWRCRLFPSTCFCHKEKTKTSPKTPNGQFSRFPKYWLSETFCLFQNLKWNVSCELRCHLRDQELQQV